MLKISLKAARVNAEIKQQEAASLLGVTPATLRNWESKKSYPNGEQIERICQLYGIKYDHIIF